MEYRETMYVPYYKKEELSNEIFTHLNRIAKLFGGWKKDMTINDYKTIWEQFQKFENAYEHYSLLKCSSEKYHQYAEQKLDEMDNEIPETLCQWFVNPNLFKKYIYLNQDPRGYALKLDTSDNKSSKNKPNELPIDGLYTDWGRYIILCPKINKEFIDIYSK